MKLVTRNSLTCLVIAKILLGAFVIYCIGVDSVSLKGIALAAEDEIPPIIQDVDEEFVEAEEIDLNFLLKKRADLKADEERLAMKRAELSTIEEELNKKLEELGKLRNEIRAEMNKKEAVEGQKLKHLIKAYSSMKPQKAAELIEKLDLDFAIELLASMKGDAVGEILTFVELERAAKISKGLATRP